MPTANVSAAAKVGEALRTAIEDRVFHETVGQAVSELFCLWPVEPASLLDKAAEGIGTLADLPHDLYQSLTTTFGQKVDTPKALAEAIGGVTYEFSAPTDNGLMYLKRGAQFAAIVAGAASGHPVWVVASTKALVQDVITDKAREQFETGIKEFFRPHTSFTATPTDPSEPTDIMLYFADPDEAFRRLRGSSGFVVAQSRSSGR